MAVYDRRAHNRLRTLGIPLSHAPGRYGRYSRYSRYSRYIEAIDQLLTAAAPDPIRNWTARDIDTALYWTTTYQHSTNLIDTPGT